MALGDSALETLPALLGYALERYAPRTAVVDEHDRRLTYGDLDERSNRVANALADRGVSVGDRVGLCVGNRLAYPVLDVAIMKAGAVRVPVNRALSADEIRYILADADVTLAIADPEVIAALTDRSAARYEDPVAFTYDDGDVDVVADSEALWSGDGAAPPTVDLGPTDLAGHFYTGGTTGDPKGVLYTQSCLVRNLLAHLIEFSFGDGEVGVLTTPLVHSAGTFLITSVLAGGRVVVQDGFDAGKLLAGIEQHAATWTFLVPTMLYRVLEEPLDAYEVSSLKRIVYGAAPMRLERLTAGIDAFGPIFKQFYGQTEVPNLITTLDPSDHRRAVETGRLDLLATAGKPCLGVDVAVVDVDTGEPQAVGDAGEVVVRAPYTFAGYHERPDATAETLVDGWVHTGDIGSIDEDGYLTLLDRKSGVVVTGGYNVYTTEVEDVLSDHPAVANVAVIGVPDPEWGEAVHAVVVPDTDVSAAELEAFATDRLSSYKRPKTYEFVDDLPTTSVGKLDKAALRERYWDGERRIG